MKYSIDAPKVKSESSSFAQMQPESNSWRVMLLRSLRASTIQSPHPARPALMQRSGSSSIEGRADLPTREVRAGGAHDGSRRHAASEFGLRRYYEA